LQSNETAKPAPITTTLGLIICTEKKKHYHFRKNNPGSDLLSHTPAHPSHEYSRGQGGPNVGQHLELLSIYLPGYSVSFVGSLVGFVYAFVGGYALGRLIGTVYNQFIQPSP
jgi:hypothetical protein